jgi:amino acid adenylation domain-containing protein
MVQERIEGFPLSPQQRRLWKLQQDAAAGPFYTRCAVRIDGELDEERLRAALVRALVRHEILRTGFDCLPGMKVPLQIIGQGDARLSVEEDLSGLDASAQSARIESLFDALERFEAGSEVRESLSAKCEPLSARLLKLRPSEHVLLLELPSMCGDAATMRNLLEELRRAYSGEPDEGDDPLQYADLAEWQNELMTADDTKAGREFWRGRAREARRESRLPFEKKPEPDAPYIHARETLHLAPERVREIERAVAGRSRTTAAALFLLTCWKILLWRLTGEREVVVGVAYDGRGDEALKDALGPLTKYLPVASGLDERARFLDLLGQVGKNFDELLQWHECFNWGYTEDGDGVEGVSALYAFDYEEWPEAQRGGEATFTLVGQYSRFDSHSVRLSCVRRADGLRLEFHYDGRLFSAEEMRRLCAEYEALLRSAAAYPEEEIGALDMLGEQERRLLLHDWNATTVEYPSDRLIHNLFEEQAERTPDATALVFEGRTLTYGELNAQANRLARHLRGLGLGHDSRVGVLMERSLEMVVALLAVLKAGAAYVPIDPEYPRERVAFMLEDSAAPVLLTQHRLLKSLPSHKAAVVALDADAEVFAEQSSDNLQLEVSPQSLAYVIYTSGSTGRPKGVMITQANILNHMLWMSESFPLGPEDCVFQKTPFSFDASVWEFYAPLLSGARLVIARPGAHRDPSYLLEVMAEQRVTVLQVVPTLLQALVETEGLERGDSLRRLFCGGEALPAEAVKRFKARMPGAEVYNLYGPTEATIDTTSRRCGEASGAASEPIGRPVANTQTYILDGQLRPVPLGTPGELYIGGAQLARGYLARGGLTAESFIPNPYGEVGGERLYRTGDLVRHLPEGEIEFLGRVDHQVKVRGYRIEIAEVEARLAQHLEVRECVVVAREDAPGEKRLVAYLVCDGERALMSAELRDFMRETLPDYMVPSAFVALDSLPLMPNGKVDRKALPAPERARMRAAADFVAPRTPVESELSEVWAQVLGVERVGVRDNFFALGGDSIRSVQVRSLALERGLRFSIQQLFERQTVEALAQVLDSEHDDAPPSGYEPFSLVSGADRAKLPEGLEDAYPLARLQLGMLYHNEYSATGSTYQDVTSFHLKMALDLRKFEEAAARLFERHPVLRTSFDIGTYSEPLQLVHRAVPLPLTVEDLRGLTDDEQERRLDELLSAEKTRRFEWSKPPLLRLHIYLRGEDDFQFTLIIHHAILDGWSVATMLTELFRLYFALKGEAEPPEPAPTGRYAEFVALERAALESEEGRAYWTRQSEDFAPAALPRFAATATVPAASGNREVGVPLTHHISEGLKAVAGAAQVPLKSVLLAAHLRVLSLLTGQEDVSTGLVSHGRPEEGDAARVLGLFLNTLPFRFRVGDGSWAELARRVFEAERELLPHRWFPLAETQRLADNTHLFEAAFNFIHFHVYESLLGLGRIRVAGMKMFEETDIPLMAHFTVDLGTSDVGLQLHFDTAKFTDAQIDAVAGYYLRALSAIAAEPTGRYLLQSLLTEEERRQVLFGWNRTHRPYPQGHTLHGLIERQVKRDPQRTAVVFEGHSLTYGELNARANQLARGLRRMGIGADVPVSVFMERSLEMVVALLGILKAGGCYMPLDTESPPERLRFMLEEAGPPVMLTQRRLSEKLPPGERRVVCLDTDWQAFADEDTADPCVPCAADNLAYVIYTSGSTGRPKGVMNTHRGICNRLLWMQETYGLTADDRVLQKTPYSFDVSVWEFFWPLLTGARLVVARPQGHRDGDYLSELIEREGITTIHFVPPMLQVFIEEPRPRLGTPLRRVICSGEALPHALQELFFARLDAELHNLYGPTEAAVDVTFRHCESNADDETVPIGRPVANTQIYILDGSLQPVPVGTPGELYIGGVQLARGYLARPDLTAERFIPNPYSETGGERLYRTGDLARHLPSGEVEYLGRIDHQVKVRGHRIELGEVEAALRRQRGVGEAVVVAREEAGGERRLVAYVVGEGGGAAPPWVELQARLAEELPPYMVPAAWVELERLPLTPNGKVDRKALPAPERRQTETDYIPPRDDLERQLTTIWEDVLNVRPLGVTANFFEFGGHSLTALRLIAKVQSLAGRRLPLSTVFDHPTIERMANFLRRQESTDNYSPLVAIQPHGTKRPLFFVHTAGGNVLRYLPLARRLGDEQPFYAFQSQDIDKGQGPSVEEMAACYIKAMLEIQPGGPYILGGWSMGGVVAFEMARQLRTQGRDVALLVLIDAKIWREGSAAKLSEAVLLVSFAIESGLPPHDLNLAKLKRGELMHYLTDRAKNLGLIQSDLDVEQLDRFFEIYKNNVQASRDYVPHALPVRGTLFKASEYSPEINREVTDDWTKLLSEIITHEVPGDHFTMMEEPYVRILASLLNSDIEAALAD